MTLTYNAHATATTVDAIKTQTDKIAAKMLFTLDFWSDLQATVALTDTAGDKTLPNVAVAELPTNATILRAIMMFKYVKRVDTSASANATVAAQVMSIDASAGRDSVVTAINIADNSFATAASTTEGGDTIIGDNDVAAEVTANATYYPTWELADCDGDALTFYDVQVGLRIWYYL